MPAEMGHNLKKKSIFIDKYGQIHEGDYFQNAQGFRPSNLERDREANRVAEEAGKVEENPKE